MYKKGKRQINLLMKERTIQLKNHLIKRGNIDIIVGIILLKSRRIEKKQKALE